MGVLSFIGSISTYDVIWSVRGSALLLPAWVWDEEAEELMLNEVGRKKGRILEG